MSRNFHNVHVHAPGQRKRDAVVKAVLAYVKKAGYERVKSAAGADRVIRLGGKAPWLSVEDDGYEAEPLALAIAKATKLSVIEAYCEASARVSLGLYANGRRAGGWAEPGKKGPAAKLVAPLLAKGTPKDLAAKWDEGIRQVFPESALALAATQLGIRPAQLFGETQLRSGATIALRRKKAKWTPKYNKGTPAFHVGWGSNGGWGGRHLVFEGEAVHHVVQVSSLGGPGRGLSIAFSGSALDAGHIEILDCKHDKLKLVRDGATNTWSDPAAKVPAGFVEAPDVFSLGRREADRARQLQWALDWNIDVHYRALKEGDCDVETEVSTAGVTASGTLDLHVNWKPWRPSIAREHCDAHQLFAMHRTEHAIAHITLRGSLADAWSWARPHVERWAAKRSDQNLRVMREFEVLLAYQPEDEAARPPYGDVVGHIGSPATPFQAAGESWLFGTAPYAPYKMDPSGQLAVQLILSAYNPRSDNDEALAAFEAICDDATASGVAYSAVVYEHQYRPDTTTRFEELTIGDSDPLKLAAWHESHIRAVDKRLWLSAAQVPLLDRTKLPDYVTVTPVGTGLRVRVADGRTRAELEPLIAALGPLVPSQAEVERWTANTRT